MCKNIDNVIPVMFCFNDNYSIPGMVALNTLLKNASKEYQYKIHILHTDITTYHQKIFVSIVQKYANAEVFFIDMKNKFDDVWSKVANHAYWSKEILYKCIACSLFPQYSRIMMTDADVIFCGDVSEDWRKFCQDECNYAPSLIC